MNNTSVNKWVGSGFVNRMLVILVAMVFFIVACNDHKAKPGEGTLVTRDTTISMRNAYSNLFLDSLKVQELLKEDNDSVREQVINFYNSRNYEFAWFDKDGLTLAAEGFWTRHNNYIAGQSDSSLFDKRLHDTIDKLIDLDSSFQLSTNELIQTEILLTKHFFTYAQAVYGARANPEELQWHIPKRKLNIGAMLDSLISQNSDTWHPLNPMFQRLQGSIFKYREIESRGGWQSVEIPQKPLKRNTRNKLIKDIKRRLSIEDYYSITDSTILFTDSLFRVVKKVQSLYGLKETGEIDSRLVKALNVPVNERIKQMLVNLERIKWMPSEPDDYILINIPEYRFRLIENGKIALAMDIVVGKAANKTVIFSNELKYIVFSPYWNIPRSIIRNEIVPAIRNNPNYLRRNNMEITGKEGGLPVVRQKPGKNNALGRVKFLFPNSYNIYFHDTPAKSLFDLNDRAFSHGCIRLQNPFALARYLLRNDSAWTDSKIKMAMNLNSEKWVTLRKPWPVFIAYFTSWTDKNNEVHFLDDIYGHDQSLKDRLFME